MMGARATSANSATSTSSSSSNGDFNNALLLSGVAHGLIIVLLIFRAVFLPSEPIEIRNAIRVDVVGLPDKVMAPTKPAPAPAPAPLPAKVELPPPPNQTPKVAEKSKTSSADLQKKALEKLKALEAIEKLKAAQTAPAEKPAESVAKGNVQSAGDSPRGIEKMQFDGYISQIRSHILEHFNLPQWLIDANLHAQALVMIDENGFVIRREIVKSSGNDIFDHMVIEAIEKSSPFAAPPAKLKSILQFRGVVFGFPD